MPSLSALQRHLQAYLLKGADAIEAHVIGTERVSATKRLTIYGNAYRARLTEALAANYPALAKLLGRTDFAALANAYILSHDSRSFSIRWYGDALEAFLASNAPYRDAPLLAALARWEWAMSEAFDAADAAPLNASALAAIAPERWSELRFGWHPSVRVLALQWNAPETWTALTNDGQRPEAQLHGEPQAWLIWRQDLTVRFRTLGAAESRVVALSRYGSTFGQLCDALCAEADEAEAATRAAACLRDWVASGLIIAATVRE